VSINDIGADIRLTVLGDTLGRNTADRKDRDGEYANLMLDPLWQDTMNTHYQLAPNLPAVVVDGEGQEYSILNFGAATCSETLSLSVISMNGTIWKLSLQFPEHVLGEADKVSRAVEVPYYCSRVLQRVRTCHRMETRVE
jgi:hypothetical protein